MSHGVHMMGAPRKGRHRHRRPAGILRGIRQPVLQHRHSHRSGVRQEFDQYSLGRCDRIHRRQGGNTVGIGLCLAVWKTGDRLCLYRRLERQVEQCSEVRFPFPAFKQPYFRVMFFIIDSQPMYRGIRQQADSVLSPFARLE